MPPMNSGTGLRPVSAANSQTIRLTYIIEPKLTLYNIYGLRSFRAFGDFKFNVLTLVESLKPITLNSAVMNKDVAAAFLFNKAISL